MAKNQMHGKSYTSEYKIWVGMKNRCLNPNADHYDRYGGRGIHVYEPWINNFMAFYEYVGARPGPEYTIDRIDNDGHYEPGNVRWATLEEQANNKSNSVKVRLDNGQVVTAKEASSLTGLHLGIPIEQKKVDQSYMVLIVI